MRLVTLDKIIKFWRAERGSGGGGVGLKIIVYMAYGQCV